MRKLIGLFVVLLMIGVVVAEAEVGTTTEEILQLQEKLKADKNVPNLIAEGFSDSRLTAFSYELDEKTGATTIKYAGELKKDGIIKGGKDSRGLEFISRVNKDGSEGAKMHLAGGSELTYKDGVLISAEIKVPVECKNGVCPPDAGKGKGYEFGNRVYPVAGGSTIKYDKIKEGDKTKEEILIKSPDGSKIYPPSKIDDKKEDGEISIRYKTEKGNMKVPSSKKGGDLVSFQSAEFDDGAVPYEMSYDVDNELFYLGKDQLAGTRNIEIGSVGSAERTYLFINKNVPDDFVGGSAVAFSSKNEVRSLQLYTPKGKGGFGVRFKSSETPGFGGLQLGENEEFLLYSFGGGKTSSGKPLVDFEGKEIPEGSSRVTIGVRADSNGQTRIPEIQSEGAFQVIDGKGIYFAHADSNGLRTRHFTRDYKFKDSASGKELTVEFGKSEPTPVKIVAKGNDGNFLKFNGVKGDVKEAKFGIFIDNNYNGYNSLRIASSSNEEALFSNSHFNEFDLERQQVLELVSKQGRNTKDTFVVIDLLRSEEYGKLSDVQKKTVNTAIGALKDIDIIKTVISQETALRDVSLDKLRKDQAISNTKTNNVGNGARVKVEDLYSALKDIRGVNMFSDKGRKDGKFAIKIGYLGCPGCDFLSDNIKGINGPVIDIDTRQVPSQYESIWRDQVNKYGDLQDGVKTIPVILYFQRDANGQVKQIGGEGYGEGRIVSGVKKFFEN